MDVMNRIYAEARRLGKTIALPEGAEERTVRAALIAKEKGLARPILLGGEDEVRAALKKAGGEADGVEVLDPTRSPKAPAYAEALHELRKNKGLSLEDARKLVADPMYYAAMMVKEGDADGYVSGAVNTTANTFRPALQIIKTAPGIPLVSSAFVMVVPDCSLGEEGVFVFADCALNPNPNPEELAAIALASAQTARSLVGMEPRVALLSFSTKGSAEHELVDKVAKATAIAKEKAPELLLDGELQLDAAIIPEIGRRKAPGSPVAGRANVLIFPDLEAGNIGYKLVQRLAKAEAIGPVSQGMAKPVNDLSRGASVEDIVNVIAITAVQGA
ncbi:MAG TPA: phosphate acetyltransferase [Firmicutes bacterium]|jgi:phosphate acetyltransferase|uniref:phosphate acetyltransferase n=1 Tax=Gelria sp. Kuro-4 TaxID=2796927 RepID=UPI001999000A|nr:phosphate acetyltransferase [Gelria sp. Kuro-4]MDK2927126.1 phosphate acetyltransferase [Bacillota bacterium]HHV57078.1 phosphate acetyltransferase [Bacillota bacterium]